METDGFPEPYPRGHTRLERRRITVRADEHSGAPTAVWTQVIIPWSLGLLLQHYYSGELLNLLCIRIRSAIPPPLQFRMGVLCG